MNNKIKIVLALVLGILIIVLLSREDNQPTEQDNQPTEQKEGKDFQAIADFEAEIFYLKPREDLGPVGSPTTSTTTTIPPTTTTVPPTTTTEYVEPVVTTTVAPKPAPSNGGKWERLAECETGQTPADWHINTGNGYYGGLQFALSSWQAVGGTGYPHEHSRAVQIQMAERLFAQGGWNHWPACSKKLGYR